MYDHYTIKDFLDTPGNYALPCAAMKDSNYHMETLADCFFNGGCFFFGFRSVHPVS
jgi:hypothetical protein